MEPVGVDDSEVEALGELEPNADADNGVTLSQAVAAAVADGVFETEGDTEASCDDAASPDEDGEGEPLAGTPLSTVVLHEP